MAAGDVTPGRRVADDTHPADLKEGEYCHRGRYWWLCTPNGLCGRLSRVRQPVREHPDGTISMTTLDIIAGELGWQGFIEAGTWWEV